MADQNLPYTIPHNTNARHAHIDALDQSNYIIILNIVSKLRKRKKEEHNIRCSHMRILLREENDIITASIQCWKANFCALTSMDKPFPTCQRNSRNMMLERKKQQKTKDI